MQLPALSSLKSSSIVRNLKNMNRPQPWLKDDRRANPVCLNALRAFEAVASSGSISEAAVVLNVSASAVSQSIKTLESFVEQSLFLRSNAGVELTPTAAAAYPAIRDGFALLVEGLARLRRSSPANVVTMSVTPSFAGKWLLPRIERFRGSHPSISIRLDSTNRLVDLQREGIDIAVRYGQGKYLDLHSEHLMAEDIFPVCSPKFLRSIGKSVLQPEDLNDGNMIHDATFDFDSSFPTWTAWLAARGLAPMTRTGGGLDMNSSVLAIQAAIEGQGVALGRSQLVQDDLASGALIKPFDDLQISNSAYYLVYPKEHELSPSVQTVRHWLLGEAQLSSASPR